MNAVNGRNTPVLKTGRTQTTPYLSVHVLTTETKVASRFFHSIIVCFGVEILRERGGPVLISLRTRPVAERTPITLSAPIAGVGEIGGMFVSFLELSAFVSF